MPRPTSDRRATERKHPWPMVRLGDVCEFVYGYPFDSAKFNTDGRGKALIRIRDVCPGETKTFTTEVPPAKYNVSKGDLLVGMDGDFNVARWRSDDAWLNQRVCMFKPDGQTLFSGYMEFVLGRYLSEIWENKSFSTVKHLSAKDLNAIKLPLPPLSVQREIVARLERELAAVEKMKKGFEALAETAKAEFKAELKEVFEEISRGGAETRRLGEVCDVFRGDYITRKTEQAGAIPVVLGGREPGYYINRSNHEGPCLVVSRSGASAGYVSYWNEPIFITDGFGIETGDSIDARFLHYQMLKNGGFASDQDGAAIPHVTGGVIRDYEVLVPPLSVQREVVVRLDFAKARAEKLEAKAREGVAVCETMRKAILKEAFE